MKPVLLPKTGSSDKWLLYERMSCVFQGGLTIKYFFIAQVLDEKFLSKSYIYRDTRPNNQAISTKHYLYIDWAISRALIG